MVTTYLYLQTLFGEDRCTRFRIIVVTDQHRPHSGHRQGRLQYTARRSLARSVNNYELLTNVPAGLRRVLPVS